MSSEMGSDKEFSNNVEVQWCPGCPNFGILNSFKNALAALGKAPHEVCLVSGIGQAAKLPHYLRCNFFNGLHGRAIPAATGIHVANPKLTTVVVTGDGDCYGEGGNHFLHCLRRNPDITVVVHNNEVYALTKGQASPTTPIGEKRALNMAGVEGTPLNMLATAIIHGCTFVARGFALNTGHLQELLIEGIKHRGLSYIDVIQPCITWGNHPLSWYKDRVFDLAHDYDSSDRDAALKMAMSGPDRVPVGILYKATSQKVFADKFRATVTDQPLYNLAPVSAETINDIFAHTYAPGG